MTLLNFRLGYHTLIEIISILTLLYAILFVNVDTTWWIFSLVVSFILSVYGMSISYHHMICHKTFKFPRFIEIILIWIGFQSTLHPPRSWALAHYAHHVYVDTENDPHTPRKGIKTLLFWNHRVTLYNRKHILIFKDLFKDKYINFLETAIGYWITILSFPILAFIVAGTNGLLFLWMIPNAYMIITSLVFTYAHNKLGAYDSFWLSIFSFGDGNHKKHHDEWNYIGKFHVLCANLIGNKK